MCGGWVGGGLGWGVCVLRGGGPDIWWSDVERAGRLGAFWSLATPGHFVAAENEKQGRSCKCRGLAQSDTSPGSKDDPLLPALAWRCWSLAPSPPPPPPKSLPGIALTVQVERRLKS